MRLEDRIESFEQYLRYEQNASNLTCRVYLEDLKMYTAHCQALTGEELSPSEQDTDLVRSWLGSMMSEGYKASSVARRLASVKSFYKYLLKMDIIKHNPLKNLRSPRGEKPLPVYVPTEYIDEILNEKPESYDWESIRNQLIIAILYECGLRRSELAGLDDNDVDTAGRKLKVLGKGNKERIIPFGHSLATQIEEWRQIRTEVFGDVKPFLLSNKGKQMTGEIIYNIVRKSLNAVPNLARRGAHTLRHSFATDMLNNGADLVAIKELMGHNNISTTVRYTHTSFRQLQEMYNAHPRSKKTKD